MEKLGVVLDDEKTKTASDKPQCPRCGLNLDPQRPTWCPNCGTEPWEKRPASR